VYGEGAQAFFANVAAGEAPATTTMPATDAFGEVIGQKRLLILMSSDRGLCGSVHTSVAKAAKNILANKPAGVVYKVVCIGDKAKALMQRLYAKELLFTANEYGRSPPSFKDASITANAILSSGFAFEGGEILYNRFKTVVSFETKRLPLLSAATISASPEFGRYDSLDDDVMKDFVEYSLAQLLYFAMKESATSEQASRMTAMDGASKNAGEMIDKLTLQFNRTRQAVITRELIEIISGAAAV